MRYNINKGLARAWNLRDWSHSTCSFSAGGLLAVFVVFVIMYMIGIDQWVCIGFGVVAALALVWLTFHLNAKYGEHGLMKLGAARQHPRYLINRKRPCRLFRRTKKGGEPCVIR